MVEESDGAHSIKPAAGRVWDEITIRVVLGLCWSVLQAVAFCRRLSTVLNGRVMAKIGDRGLKRGLIAEEGREERMWGSIAPFYSQHHF